MSGIEHTLLSVAVLMIATYGGYSWGSAQAFHNGYVTGIAEGISGILKTFKTELGITIEDLETGEEIDE